MGKLRPEQKWVLAALSSLEPCWFQEDVQASCVHCLVRIPLQSLLMHIKFFPCLHPQILTRASYSVPNGEETILQTRGSVCR